LAAKKKDGDPVRGEQVGRLEEVHTTALTALAFSGNESPLRTVFAGQLCTQFIIFFSYNKSANNIINNNFLNKR